MKENIRMLVKDIFGFVFSFGTLMLVSFGLLVYVAINSSRNESEQQERKRIATELCYNQAMVLVDTDAGPRCAAPANLAKIK